MRYLLLVGLLLACDGDPTEAPAADAALGDIHDHPPAPDGAPDGAPPEPDAAPPGQEENFGVEETVGRPECDNLLETHCLMPFPSDRYLVDGQVRFDDGAIAPDGRGRPIRGDMLASADGWGITTPPILYWPGVSVTGLTPVFDLAASLEADARTIILDAETGERVPHWVEPDYLTFDAAAPNLVFRTAKPFDFSRRYVVAVRGLVDEAGALVPAPPGFAALRDGAASDRVGIHARRARFERDVFAPLAEAGIDRGELQLAWDFTTGSAENATGLLREMRDLLLEAVGPMGPEYTIESVEEDVDPYVAARAVITVHIPSFLEPADPLGKRRLRRDAEGRPKLEGFEDWEMVLNVPRVLVEGEDPPIGGVLQYGHGFLGTSVQGERGWIRDMAQRFGFVIIATDMQGMSSVDTAYWGANLSADPAAFPEVTEKALQGILNQVVMQRLMKGRFLQEAHPLLTRPGGAPVYDPERVWYYGNSQGGTIGSIVMAVTPEVTRGVLGVPGCCYPILLHRSTVFTDFVSLLSGILPNKTDLGIMLALIGGTGFRSIDPANYAPFIVDKPLPDTPRHEVLLHVGKEDAQVHNQVSYMLGRAIGVPLPVPAIRPVFGFEERPYPYEGGGLVEFDFSVPENPDPLLPPPGEFDTHGSPRSQPEAQEQMLHFLETGELVDTCEGSCVFPERP